MAALRGVEKNRINGHVIPMENYGSLQSPGDDDTINFAAADELVSPLRRSCVTVMYFAFRQYDICKYSAYRFWVRFLIYLDLNWFRK